MEIRKKDIECMESLLIEGIKESNLDFLDKVIHHDLLCMGPDGQVITKEMDMAAHKEGAMVVEELIPVLEEIKISGDTAVSIMVYETKGTMMGSPVAGRFRYLRVWKKFDDGLKVIAASCFRIP